MNSFVRADYAYMRERTTLSDPRTHCVAVDAESSVIESTITFYITFESLFLAQAYLRASPVGISPWMDMDIGFTHINTDTAAMRKILIEFRIGVVNRITYLHALSYFPHKLERFVSTFYKMLTAHRRELAYSFTKHGVEFPATMLFQALYCAHFINNLLCYFVVLL